MTSSVDITNKNPKNIKLHFEKVNKISYNSGKSVVPSRQNYDYINPAVPISTIISADGNNIDEIKKYFCSEYIIGCISKITGMN